MLSDETRREVGLLTDSFLARCDRSGIDRRDFYAVLKTENKGQDEALADVFERVFGRLVAGERPYSRPVATLIGGPHDGETVEVVGVYHARCHQAKCGPYRFIESVYAWEYELKDGKKTGKWLGRFAGYQARGGQPVDRLGRRLRKKCTRAPR